MIYFASIIDVTMGGGTPKWDFIHPETPRPLMERLAKYRDHVASFIYAIIEAFGGEILGDQLRELRLSEIQVIFSVLKHKDLLFYVVFVADIKDNPKAVNKIFMEFYKKYYNDFDELLTSEIISQTLIEKLRTAMAQFLVQFTRVNKLFGTRDIRHLIASYVVSLAITFVLVGITWLINHMLGLMDSSPITFALLVFFMVFVLPALPIGYLTEYRRFAVLIAYMNSITTVVGATIVWQPLLLSYARFVWEATTEYILLGAAILGGLMLGTILAMLSYIIAQFFEYRTLTSVRELRYIKPMESVPIGEEIKSEEEEEEAGVKAPSMEDMGFEEN